ncbi:MAG: PAS domain-containing sensor histidine kinase, partial [Proteobacteria bacterium]
IFGTALGDKFDHTDLVNLIHPDDLPMRNEAVANAYRVGSLNYQARLIWPDKSIHWVSVYGKIAYDQNNVPVKMYGTALDISREKMMAEELERRVALRTAELKQANDELIRTNQELEQFAYVSSHDLQEPLRKIQTFSDLVLKRVSPDQEDVHLHVQKIRSSALRMSVLINDLLNYSRISKAAENFVTIDLNKVLEDIRNDFEVVINQKAAVIEAVRSLGRTASRLDGPEGLGQGGE